jgi:hypothetical protein
VLPIAIPPVARCRRFLGLQRVAVYRGALHAVVRSHTV